MSDPALLLAQISHADQEAKDKLGLVMMEQMTNAAHKIENRAHLVIWEIVQNDWVVGLTWDRVLQLALTNPVDLEINNKQEVVSTEQGIDAVTLTGIDMLPAINQIVPRSLAHGEIMDNVDQMETMGNNVGMANRIRLEHVQMEPRTNVNRVKGIE